MNIVGFPVGKLKIEVLDEAAMEKYLEEGELSQEEVVEVEGGNSGSENHLLEESLPFDEITASELKGVDFDLDDNSFDPEEL